MVSRLRVEPLHLGAAAVRGCVVRNFCRVPRDAAGLFIASAVVILPTNTQWDLILAWFAGAAARWWNEGHDNSIAAAIAGRHVGRRIRGNAEGDRRAYDHIGVGAHPQQQSCAPNNATKPILPCIRGIFLLSVCNTYASACAVGQDFRVFWRDKRIACYHRDKAYVLHGERMRGNLGGIRVFALYREQDRRLAQGDSTVILKRENWPLRRSPRGAALIAARYLGASQRRRRWQSASPGLLMRIG